MAYHLSFLDVLKAFFVPVDPVYTLVYGGVILLPLLLLLPSLLRQFRQEPFFRNFRPFIFVETFILGTAIAVLFWLGYTYTGSGVRVENSVLEIKASFGAPVAVELKGARIDLMEYGKSWKPELRTNGLSLPGLSVGYFKFNNDEEVLYFRYGEPSHKVVLESNGRYYVLAYPGVEKLYQELVVRGVRPDKL